MYVMDWARFGREARAVQTWPDPQQCLLVSGGVSLKNSALWPGQGGKGRSRSRRPSHKSDEGNWRPNEILSKGKPDQRVDYEWTIFARTRLEAFILAGCQLQMGLLELGVDMITSSGCPDHCVSVSECVQDTTAPLSC